MKDFIDKHSEDIDCVLSSFDRVLFKGHLPISSSEGMTSFLSNNGVLIKDFKKIVPKYALELKAHAMETAAENERPYMNLNSGSVRKEDMARGIAKRDGVERGLVCVFSSLEACNSFKVVYGDGRPEIRNATRKCLCLYYDVIDPDFGLMHIRIQTWFPFTVQICVNGHEWLAMKMDRNRMEYRKDENCFTMLGEPKRAQKFADKFINHCVPKRLSAIARNVNPFLCGGLRGMDYYWITEQAEYSTDVIFKNGSFLELLYKKLLDHSILRFGAEDVLAFLGKKLDGRFKGEQMSSCKRVEGARVKHWMKGNWIKMYNKSGVVLRIETVVNQPYDFKVFREGIRDGEKVKGWFPMAKRVCNLHRYAEISLGANGRYLDALAAQNDPRPAAADMRRLSFRVVTNGKSCRGFNPAAQDDICLFEAVMKGRFIVSGFRNKDIRSLVFTLPESARERSRLSARTTSLLKRLQVHGLISKVPRSRRWTVTSTGYRIMGTVIAIYNEEYLRLTEKIAS